MSETVQERLKQDRDAFYLGVQAAQPSELPDKHLTEESAKVIVENCGRVIGCAENGRHFIASSCGNAPETIVAMDLPCFTLSVLRFLPISERHLREDIDEAQRLGLGTDMCTLIRLGIRCICRIRFSADRLCRPALSLQWRQCASSDFGSQQRVAKRADLLHQSSLLEKGAWH